MGLVVARSAHTSGSTGRGRAGGVRRKSVQQQVREQRRRYATAVVGSLARTYRGQPVSEVRQVLLQSLTPLGVRLGPDKLSQLAASITAGHPEQL